MWVEDYQWHYDYVRLAWDTGFAFEKCKSPNLDKNKICVVDVERIVKERDVASVDRYISTVVQYILEEEQAKVLDTNFVKIFRISQLAVEYLLFCKKYLDNTVVLIKKELSKNREENRELKVFIEDLQAHIEMLTKQQMLATFKCSSCSKVFSSEEYLNAHVKRRHSNQSNESYNSETDKLNLEIKELKERLNNTEKILKEKDEQNPEKNFTDFSTDNSKMTELLEKFDQFKSQVDNELKELKIQKSFYEENYGKLFDIVIQNKENMEPKNEMRETPKTETTTTQTDRILQIENVNNKNVVEIQELIKSSSNREEKNEELDINKTELPQTERKSIEAKISTTLSDIEGKMQAFWNKLNEIEQNKSKDNNLQSPCEVEDQTVVKEVKPRAKPRSKFSQPTPNTSRFSNNTEKLKMAIQELEQQQKENQQKSNEILIVQKQNGSPDRIKPIKVRSQLNKSDNVEEEDDSEDESYSESGSSATESETDISEQDKQITVSKPNTEKLIHHSRPVESNSESPEVKKKATALSNLEKRSHSSPKKKSSTKTITNLNKEIKVMVSNRLQELGISESWTRLPLRSFDKAMEIINHQATLTKKTYTNFNSIKKRINSEIEKQCNRKFNGKPHLKEESSKMGLVKNIVRVSYRPKSGRKLTNEGSSVLSPIRKVVEIKNRSLYETDTESDQNNKQPHRKTTTNADAPKSHQLYSNVVNELKSLPNLKSQTDEDSIEEANKDPQKGVLKNYPSVGSLSKKKVLFDLENDETTNAPAVQKTGGSTTSIASSILGEKADNEIKNEGNDKERSNIKNIEKDFDELSDFDLSELE